MTDKQIIPLACFGIDRLLLTEVARTLWCDIYWTEDREEEYGQTHGMLHIRELTERPETPDIPDLDSALFSLFHSVGRIEQAWGLSFHAVACEMHGKRENLTPAEYRTWYDTELSREPFRQELERLVYRTLMACIGHGIDASDLGGFPENLNSAPISIENPLQDQELTQVCENEPVVIKVTEGAVVQEFHGTCCVRQEFKAGDLVVYETEDGNSAWGKGNDDLIESLYQPFDMVQP